MAPVSVELYTHPVCSGCQEALTELGALAGSGVIELQVRSLATPDGQRDANAAGVTTVPSVRVTGEIVELRRRADLRRLVERLRGPAGDGA